MHLPAWTGLWSSLFLFPPAVTGALDVAVLHLQVALHLLLSLHIFLYLSLSETCLLVAISVDWDHTQELGLIEDPWLYGGTGYAAEVPLHCPPLRDASPVKFHPQPKSSWTCSWHDEQRLPLFSEDAQQLLHTQALLHRVCTLLHMKSLLIEVNASNY